METSVEKVIKPLIVTSEQKVIRTEGFYLGIIDRVSKLVVRILVAILISSGTTFAGALIEFFTT